MFVEFEAMFEIGDSGLVLWLQVEGSLELIREEDCTYTRFDPTQVVHESTGADCLDLVAEIDGLYESLRAQALREGAQKYRDWHPFGR